MFKKYIVIVVYICIFSYLLIGCGRKQESSEQLQEQAVIEIDPVFTPDLTSGELDKEGIPLPPQGPYKPTGQQIQLALQNAGYYSGKIDGKIGPQTKEAIKNFQSANNLEADGKVGPKTWHILKRYIPSLSE